MVLPCERADLEVECFDAVVAVEPVEAEAAETDLAEDCAVAEVVEMYTWSFDPQLEDGN